MPRLGRAYPVRSRRLRPQQFLVILLADAVASDTASASAVATVGIVSTVIVPSSVVSLAAFMPPMIGDAGSTMLPDAAASAGSVHSLSGSQSVMMV